LVARSCGCSRTGYIAPCTEGGLPEDAVFGGRYEMAVQLEVEINTVVSGQEALCLARLLDPLHLPFSSSYWLVRKLRPLVRSLRPVVQIATLPMFGLWQEFSLGRRIALQLVRRDYSRLFGPACEQFPKETFGASVTRCCWTRMSSTAPFWSAARQR